MSYYLVTDYWPGALYADIHEVRPLGLPDGIYAVPGRPLHKDFPTITVIVGTLESLPPYFHAGGYLLMSPTLVEAVKRTGERHFEVRPIRVVGILDGEDTSSYRLVHFLDLVPCLDLSKSVVDISEWDGSVEKIHRLALEEDRIPEDRHLFKLKEYPKLIASDRLREEFARAGVPRTMFQPVEDFDSDVLYRPKPE